MNTHHRTIRSIVLLLVLVVVVGACGEAKNAPTTTTAAAAPAGPVELPVNPDPPKSSTIYATLQGDAGMEGGCVWLRQTTTDFGVLWPAGYTAEFDPIRLYDADGTLVGEEGDRLVVTGAFAIDPADYQPYRCAAGTELWLAGTVEKND
jgi:hypothetical protein